MQSKKSTFYINVTRNDCRWNYADDDPVTRTLRRTFDANSVEFISGNFAKIKGNSNNFIVKLSRPLMNALSGWKTGSSFPIGKYAVYWVE